MTDHDASALTAERLESSALAPVAVGCEHPQVSAALDFLRTHSHEAIYLPEIARAVGISVRSLQSLFKAEAGRTISEEITRMRLEHAARLLRETGFNLQSVAQQSGLSSAKYLCHLFRPAFHMTPIAYRAAMATPAARPIP